MRSRDPVLVAAVVAIGVAMAVAPATLPASAEIVDRIDEAAPEIECAKWVAGQPAQILKLRGRVVVLHFSDPERITSQAALSPMRKLATAWKDAPVTIVEVVTSSAEDVAAKYATKEAPPWAVGWDAKGASAGRYPGTSVPRTYLIGPDGRITWHAHAQALTKDLVQAQVERVQFFAPGPDVKRAKNAAKHAAEQRFGQALAESAKVDADKTATDADRAIVAAIRADVARTHAMYKKLVDKLAKELDWGVASQRAQRMTVIFKGTEFEADVNAYAAKLDALDIVRYVRPAQDKYDELVETAAKARSRHDIDNVLGKLRTFAVDYQNTKPAERAGALIQALEKRLEEMSGK